MRVRSRRSSIRRLWIVTLRRIISRSSRVEAGRLSSAASAPEAASTGVSGVRSSCESMARNSSLARLADSSSCVRAASEARARIPRVRWLPMAPIHSISWNCSSVQ